MPLLIIRQDITKMDVDAIINPTNTHLSQGRGTSRGVYLAAGEEQLTRTCEQIGHCDIGKAVITDGFNLPAKYIIHAVGPAWTDGKSKKQEKLYSAYTESLILAQKYELESIAFPLITSGSYGFPKKEALKIAVSAINDFLLENDMLVYLAVYDNEALNVSKKLFDDIEEYIDDYYVDTNYESYVSSVKLKAPCMASPIEQSCSDCDTLIIEECFAKQPQHNIDELINKKEETFSQMLLRLIDERNMTDAEAYKKANVDRKLFSKIRSNEYYSPSKKTILCFAIALELSMEETTELLKKAGFALSHSIKQDVIVEYFIKNGKYDIFEINEVLFQYELPILGGA